MFAQISSIGMASDKIKVRMKVRGVEVEIEAPPDQIQRAVREVIAGLGEGQQEGEQPRFAPASCKEAIEMLWREGWFSEPRRLYDVWRELSERGYNYDRSAISHALNDLTKEGVLTRLGKARRYRYVQKRPYVVSSITRSSSENPLSP